MSTAVIDRLLADPHRFGFFQAVRLLERWFVSQEGLVPAEVLNRRVRFRNSLSLSFAPSEIARLAVVPADPAGEHAPTGEPLSRAVKRIELTPAFIGLLGVNGCLPAAYTEFFSQGKPESKDSAAGAFLDIFLNRAVALFYQAWRKHRLAIRFESDRCNQYLPLVMAIAGVGQPALRNRLRGLEGGIADETLAFYAGVLQQKAMSATLIQRVIAQHFKVAAHIDQFVGRWFLLPQENQTCLSSNGTSSSTASGRLGSGAVVGERMWQRDLRMRLTLGPMSMDSFRRFLPGGPSAVALHELLTMMTGVAIEYDVRLSLRREDVKGVRLDRIDGSRLGRDGFLATRASNEDRIDAGYELHAVA